MGGKNERFRARQQKPMTGQYLYVALVLDSPDVADATSNMVVVKR